MPAHIYFDLDGTLTDPYEGITRCILYALDRLGFPQPDDDYLYSCIGPPLWDTFPELVGEELTKKAVELYRERFVEIGWQENTPYPGIHATLDAVASAGHTLFVATAKPHRHAAKIIEHFGMGDFIDNVYGSELDGTRATKSELLRFAIEKNPGNVERVMIGDRKHDLIGAIANRMTPIGVAWGYGSTDELERAGATAIASSPGELPALLPPGVEGAAMSIHAEQNLTDYFAEVVCSGPYSTAALLEVLDDALDFAAANGREALLLDVSTMSGTPTVSDRFEIGSKGAELQIGKSKLVTIAFVGKQPLIDSGRFGETVAVNRCAVVKVFENREEAIQWLEHTTG